MFFVGTDFTVASDREPLHRIDGTIFGCTGLCRAVTVIQSVDQTSAFVSAEHVAGLSSAAFGARRHCTDFGTETTRIIFNADHGLNFTM